MINITDMILFSVLFVALLIGSITDFKKREVPDWISFALIAAGLGLRLTFSLLTSNWAYIINGLAGFILFIAIAYAMFYAGQWGGGDSKVLMGIGAVLGLSVYPFSLIEIINSTIIGFFINALLIGAVFGILFAVYLAIRKWKLFKAEFIKRRTENKNRKAALILTILFLCFMVLFFFTNDLLLKATFIFLAFLTLPTLYVYLFIKSVETACMMKYVKPTELTEGDWIVKDIKMNGRRICGPKDLGIEKEQISTLIKFYKKGKIKKVLIKEGVPFVPSFFIALIVTLLYGNWFFNLIMI